MSSVVVVFIFNVTAATEIYRYLHTLSRHDALPIWRIAGFAPRRPGPEAPIFRAPGMTAMNSPQVREGEPARGLPSGRKGLEPRDHGERLGPVEDRRDTHVGANGELALGEEIGRASCREIVCQSV